MALFSMTAKDAASVTGGGNSSMFDITLDQLTQLMGTPKNEFMSKLYSSEYNGVEGILTKLKVNKEEGLGHLDEQELEQRRKAYGQNIIPKEPVPAYISPTHWLRERNLRHTQDESEKKRTTFVIRDNNLHEILVSEVVVGDICLIKTGDTVPADGLIFQTKGLLVEKFAGQEEQALVTKTTDEDVVLYSGTRVMDGFAKMVVVAVGVNSQLGISLKLLAESVEEFLRNNPT